MYAIVRGDLEMTPGKMAAMTGHAFKLLTRNLHNTNPALEEAYFADGMGTNVILKAKNEHAILRAYEEAQKAGLSAALIVDEHHIIPDTAFTGEPIITALGIGPATREQIQHITKRFSASL
jgi:PTH2 family peptidyl-tRNA hydrolase